MKILPQTKLGKWSAGLIVAMPALFIIGNIMVSFLYPDAAGGDTILADITARPGIALPMLSGFACGIGAFITGLVAVVKSKERAVSVFIAIIFGALLIVFLAGEVALPH